MKKTALVLLIAGLLFTACTPSSDKQQQADESALSETTSESKADSIVYETDHLIIQQLSGHCYLHVSYLNTDEYGKVGCNGMIVVNENEAVVFDTPADSISSQELIHFVTAQLQSKITAIIPTHFHEDCVGGISAFDEHHIPAYASNQTIELLKEKGIQNVGSLQGFDNNLDLTIGNKKVLAAYFGEGHTRDNIVGYYPEDKVVFGGCLIKANGAGKGNLADANVDEWSETVRKVKQQYPDAVVVIPGHGKSGGIALFDYTIEKFQ